MREIKNLEKAIGNTPLAKIDILYKNKPRTIYAKLEYYNLTGSVKDRMAYYILKKAIEKSELKEGYEIAEATSGNTGIAFCALSAYLGLKAKIFMPDWMSLERVNIIKSFGAEIVSVSKAQGGFLGSIKMAEDYAKNGNVFLPRQFENPDNVEGQYNSLGKELVENLEKMNLVCDGFVAGVGTGGTVMGVMKALKEKNPEVKVYPLEPLESPTLSTGNKVGNHRIAGISDEFIPEIVKLDELDEVITVSDGDSILMAQKLARAGLGVGISSGGNFIGALKALEELGEEKIVATVFCDDNKKYLSTDLMREEPVKEGYLSPEVEIKNIEIFR